LLQVTYFLAGHARDQDFVSNFLSIAAVGSFTIIRDKRVHLQTHGGTIMEEIDEKKGGCHAIVTVGGIRNWLCRCLSHGACIVSHGSHRIEGSIPIRGGLLRATLPLGCNGKGHGSSSLFVNGNGAFGKTIQAVALPKDNGNLGAFGKLKK
jgi:hypothetical protein